jgi:hypothetical protein
MWLWEAVPENSVNVYYNIMKSYVLIGFITLAIVVLIFITRQQREKFVQTDNMLAQKLVKPNIRLSKIQKSQEKLEDAMNAGAGKAAIKGIL